MFSHIMTVSGSTEIELFTVEELKRSSFDLEVGI